MLRIAICDDEERYVSDVKCMLQKWATEVSAYIQIYCFHDGDSLIQEAETIQFDIVFLDIVMPLINGFDTAKELRSKDKTVKIIFLTSSPEFALQSYSVKATNYCLKPLTYEKLKEVLDDCTNVHQTEPENLVLKQSADIRKFIFMILSL